MPWLQAAIHFDNANSRCFGPHRGDWGGAILLCAAPGIYKDGLYDWWIHHICSFEGRLVGDPSKWDEWDVRVMVGAWARFLWHDDAPASLGPENFPPSRYFATRGMASMRDNGGKDATFVHFRCGACPSRCRSGPAKAVCSHLARRRCWRPKTAMTTGGDELAGQAKGGPRTDRADGLGGGAEERA